MITIIKQKETPDIKNTICRLCGCIFTYQDEDTHVDNHNCLHVSCPNCGREIFAGVLWKKEKNGVH